MVRKNKSENVYNIPNTLSLLRIILSPILIFLVFQNYPIWIVVVIFAIAALTDFADGYIARRYNLVTELGRKLDMFADRILMISIVLAIIAYMQVNNLLIEPMIIQIIMLMAREIISTPFFIMAIVMRLNVFPNARKIAKLTTLLQGLSLPMIILGWQISIFFSLATLITGIISGIYYARDTLFAKNIRDRNKK